MDLKISQLPQASSINFSDEFAIAQSGTTKSIDYSALLSKVQDDITIKSKNIDFTTIDEGISYRLIGKYSQSNNTYLTGFIGAGWKAIRIYWTAETSASSATIHLRPYGSDYNNPLTTHVAKLGIGVNLTNQDYRSIADIAVRQDGNVSGFSVCQQNNDVNYATFISVFGTGGSLYTGNIVMESATVQRATPQKIEAFALTCSTGTFKYSYMEIWGHK